MKTLSAELIKQVAQHVADHEISITHFGKQVAPETTQAGIAYINMLTQVRIAEALERIADSLQGASTNIDPEATVG